MSKGRRKLIAYVVGLVYLLLLAAAAIWLALPEVAVSSLATAGVGMMVGFAGGNVGEHWASAKTPTTEAPIL